MSFGSTSPSLSDRSKFPLFFRTVAPDSSHNAAKIQFVKYFDWKIVATLSQSENEYLLPINKLIGELENQNVSCFTSVTFSLDNFKDQLQILKDSDVRIIIASLSTSLSAKIFCEIYRLEMYGDYVWILQDRQEIWWRSTADCDLKQLETAVNSMILVSDYNVVSEDATSVSGLVIFFS